MKNYHLPFCWLFFTFVLAYSYLPAQEQLGLRLENRAGVNSWALNPAWHVTSPYVWDLNFAEAHATADNNYGFIDQFGLTQLIKHQSDLTIFFDDDGEKQADPANGVFASDFYTNGQKRYAFVSSGIMGPSLFFRAGVHTIGFFAKGRAMANARNIPNKFSYYDFYNQVNREEFSIHPFSVSAMAWSEVGLNYSITVPTGNGILAIGVSPKFLKGYESAFFRNGRTFSMAKWNTDSLSGTGLDLELGYTQYPEELEDVQAKGKGFGLDLGFVITGAGNEEGEYTWKLGVSIVDIGSIKFNKTAQLHKVMTDSTVFTQLDSYENLNAESSLEDIAKAFGQEVLGDSTATFASDQYSMWLPSGLSMQFDVALTNRWYLNAMVMQGVPLNKTAANRGNLIAITPRWESGLLGVAAPVSFYNFHKLRLGLAARIAFLNIGTDNLGSIIGKGKFTGSDFYVALKLPHFLLGSGGSGKAGRAGTKGKEQGCYTF